MKLLNFTSQKGSIFPLALIVLTSLLVITLVLVSNSFTLSQSSRYSLDSLEAANLADAGIDKAVAALNKSGGTYNGEAETILGPGSYSVTVTSKDASTNIVTATGYIPSKTNPKSKKTVQIQISKGIGVSFIYGMQVGEGGINMGNGAKIIGSVYSNGNINTGNSATITGDVYVAGGVQPDADQESDCIPPNCADFIFGKNDSGNLQLDISQSFKPGSSLPSYVLNKVALKLKKFGSPPNLTVRILGDNNGKPNKTEIAHGTLYANLVTSTYGFIEVAFSNPPTLNSNNNYWIMLDTCGGNPPTDCSGGTNYWAWSGDLLQSYTGGASKWSPNWNATNPVWNNPSPQQDLAFKTFMGGVATHLSFANGAKVTGNVHANTISGGNGGTITGSAYYQFLDPSVTVNGTIYPGSSDPGPTVFPVSDANIADWKAQAETGTHYSSQSGGNSCTLALGPGKVTGNINLGNGCTVTVKTPLWVTGNINAGNSTKFIMDSSLGSTSGMILVDGKVGLANGCDIQGSGTAGSYLMLLSTYDSRANGEEAIDSGNSSISGILYAPNGIINLANGASFKEINAWKINMGNSAQLNYEEGLASLLFSSGPTGSFSAIKGTYQLK